MTEQQQQIISFALNFLATNAEDDMEIEQLVIEKFGIKYKAFHDEVAQIEKQLEKDIEAAEKYRSLDR